MEVPAYNSPPVGLKQQDELEVSLYIPDSVSEDLTKLYFPILTKIGTIISLEDKMNIKHTHPAETKMK